MEIVKDVAYARVVIHDGTPGRHDEINPPDEMCRSCPWGMMYRATLVVNGYPHKHILRFDPRRLHRDATEWLQGMAI